MTEPAIADQVATPQASRPPRVAFLYSEPSPYMVACWRELKDRYDAELFIIHWAPFSMRYDELGRALAREPLSKEDISREVAAFAPDGVFISGWADSAYMAVAKDCKRRGIPVILGLDTQWTGSARQRLGCATARWWLHPAVNIIWTPGERQAQLAGRLGYRGANCWYGVYSCDWRAFSQGDPSIGPRQDSFLYVGRYVEEKGIQDLVVAYKSYRSMVDDPWPLYCAGTGPLKHMLSGVEGITDLGFIDPENLPGVMRQYGGVFLLPSRVEPWGVVLQEAAAAGCPIICSDACGAAVHMLQDGHNGLRFATGKPQQLADCMYQLAESSPERRSQMGKASSVLALQFTPERWAQTLVEGISRPGAAD
jgi:glycosyltransferase involved in cell wall biosynthesis